MTDFTTNEIGWMIRDARGLKAQEKQLLYTINSHGAVCYASKRTLMEELEWGSGNTYDTHRAALGDGPEVKDETTEKPPGKGIIKSERRFNASNRTWIDGDQLSHYVPPEKLGKYRPDAINPAVGSKIEATAKKKRRGTGVAAVAPKIEATVGSKIEATSSPKNWGTKRNVKRNVERNTLDVATEKKIFKPSDLAESDDSAPDKPVGLNAWAKARELKKAA